MDNLLSVPTVREAESVFDVVCAPWLVTKRDYGIVVLALSYIVPMALAVV